MRKGLGIGRGKGYRNILIHDSPIHAQSRMGISQPQKTPIYKGTYGRKLANPQELVNNLKAMQLGDVHYTGKKIIFNFDGKRISNKVKFNGRVGNIANWGHSLKDNRVFIDKDAPYPAQLALHEAIEQYASENYGLRYPEAHDIATHFEKVYADRQGIDWDKSQKAIYNTKI